MISEKAPKKAISQEHPNMKAKTIKALHSARKFARWAAHPLKTAKAVIRQRKIRKISVSLLEGRRDKVLPFIKKLRRGELALSDLPNKKAELKELMHDFDLFLLSLRAARKYLSSRKTRRIERLELFSSSDSVLKKYMDVVCDSLKLTPIEVGTLHTEWSNYLNSKENKVMPKPHKAKFVVMLENLSKESTMRMLSEYGQDSLPIMVALKIKLRHIIAKSN